MTEHAEGARSRSAREVLPNLLAGLWAITAAPLVWWSGVELWREVTPCAPRILLATVVLTWGILFMAVGAGAVPALVARMTGALWLPWLALLPSLAVLGLYAMIMISATSFGLSEHPDRVPAAIPDIFVSFAPSVALGGLEPHRIRRTERVAPDTHRLVDMGSGDRVTGPSRRTHCAVRLLSVTACVRETRLPRPRTKKPRREPGLIEDSVEPVHRYSNKSALLPPPLVELQKLADLRPNAAASATPVEQVSRSLRRRLEPALVKQIASEYEAGATTPSLCVEYSISKGGLLKLLRDEGAQLRRRPLSDEQIREAIALYKEGHSLATIAADLKVSYNCVRHAFVGAGIERRPRGGSKPHA